VSLNDDKTGNGREYVRNTLESTVKDDLIKRNDYVAPVATSIEPLHNHKIYSIRARKKQGQSFGHAQSRYTEKQNPQWHTSTQTRIYSTPEQNTGSTSLSGAAATAIYVSTTEKIIKDDKTGIGREYVRSSLESTVKNDLIKIKRIVAT